MKLVPPCRLFVLFARDATRAVVFRRGPAKQVRLILWHTDTDTFEQGQWFKGRIYAERCDLSPNGEYLIYFAGNFKDPLQGTWTAISRPPYLTAISFWPKGDTWGGGGWFEDDRTVRVSESLFPPDAARPTPPWLTVKSTGDVPSVERRALAGWTKTQVLKTEGDTRWRRGVVREPEVWSRMHPDGKYRLRLVMGVPGYGALTERYSLHQPNWEVVPLSASQADFDQRGRLIAVYGGKLFGADLEAESAPDFRCLHDFNPQTFEPMVAPEWATHW